MEMTATGVAEHPAHGRTGAKAVIVALLLGALAVFGAASAFAASTEESTEASPDATSS